MDRNQIIKGVSQQVSWWIGQRVKKLKELSHETMAVNPFLIPLLMGLHCFKSFEELADFLIGGHFSTGHATGFGKLVDEKILPNVFGTTPVNANFRRNPPYNRSLFDEIDHLVYFNDEHPFLLSQKSGRWTIQLTMAVQLNKAFKELVEAREKGEINFSKIVVGVFYGTQTNLTDKYDILRGINRGAKHDVTDLTEEVKVYAGREFWAWLNNGETQTQEWVMEGILTGFEIGQVIHQPSPQLVESYKNSFSGRFQKFIDSDGSIDWYSILKEING